MLIDFEDEIEEMIRADDADELEPLLGHGLSLTTRDANGDTPLIAAAFNNSSKAVELFLENAADINARGANGDTALIVAAAEGHAEVVRLLLKAGANAGLTNAKGETALSQANKQGCSETAALLQAAVAPSPQKGVTPQNSSTAVRQARLKARIKGAQCRTI